jgi:hypothetical protein
MAQALGRYLYVSKRIAHAQEIVRATRDEIASRWTWLSQARARLDTTTTRLLREHGPGRNSGRDGAERT